VITVEVKGEFAFGLPWDYEPIQIAEPSFDAIMDHYDVKPVIRKHLLPLVNDEITTLDRQLEDGDQVILSSPYSGG
jgi:molybdopterin converting factor small subunit